MMLPVRLALVLSLLMASWVTAATYHVQKTGSSDSNSCTAGSPCLTIQRGLDVMSGGDTLIIHSGTYAEGNLTPPSGSSGAPTLLQAAAGETVTIRPNDADLDTIFNFQTDEHHITIDGFILDGSDVTDFIFYAEPLATPPVSYITVSNSEIMHAFQSGLLIGGTNWDIRNNHIHHNGQNCCATTSDDHGIYMSAGFSQIVGNRFNNNACYNIQNYGGPNPTDNVYDGNSFTDSKCGMGLVKGQNHLFINNIIYDDATFYESNALNVWAVGSKIYNNTLVNVNLQVLNEGDEPGAGVELRNNIVWNGTIYTLNATQSNNLLTNPSFVDEGSANFHLQSGSDAIDAGMTLGLVTTDYDGSPRTGTYEIGAFAFATGDPVATSLAFVQQPTTTGVGISLAPAVTVRIMDQFGDTFTSSAAIALAIADNPNSGTLSGDVNNNAISGVATFPDLSIDLPGVGYTLSASSSGLPSITSSLFNITVAGNNLQQAAVVSLRTMGPVQTASTVNTQAPLFHKLRAWWRVVPALDGAHLFFDLLRNAYMTLMDFTSLSGHRPTMRPGADGEIRLSGDDNAWLSAGTRVGATKPFSIVFWLKEPPGTTQADWAGVVGQVPSNSNWDTGWGLYTRESLLTCFVEGYSVNFVTTAVVFNPSDWVQVACTWDGTTIELYLDGVSQGTTPYTGTLSTGYPFEIGTLGGSAEDQTWDGSVDDVMLFDRGLAAWEVHSLRSLSLDGWPQELRRWTVLDQPEVPLLATRKRGAFAPFFR